MPRIIPRLYFLFVVLLTAQRVVASILAVDYGTDWIKASLIKPGVPFDVLLNRDSKRKIQSSVGWKGGDRLFASDAFNIAARFPKDSFSHLKSLQGQTFDSDAVSFYTSISSAEIIETARKTVGLRSLDHSEWSVEELIAMQFTYVKELAEDVAGEKVVDVVVTVPPFYSQFERQAVLDAVEVSGLRPIALINDGTAVAVNYAMTRTFPTPENHIIYDAGAGSIRATLLTFSSGPPADTTTISSSKTNANTTLIETKSIGYARGAGGNELDRRLRDLLIHDFEAKHHKDIREDARGMAKLWKEAGRLKAVLSANTDASSAVESVAFDIDYKSKISRARFEESLADLKPSFAQPILDALANANLTLNDITSVIFTGGSTRTPIIQQAVRDVVGEAKIALNVNADEAAVLGAAFYGASLSRQFKTKGLKVNDVTAYDIQVSYSTESKLPAMQTRTINTLLFPAGSKYGSKKTLTLKRKEDILLSLSYKYPQAGVFPGAISQAEIVGVAEALANLTERGAVQPVIKVTLALSESGFAVVQDAAAFGVIKDESLAGKLKGLFGGTSSSDESSTELSNATASPSARPEDAEGKDKDNVKEPSTIKLQVDVAPLSIHPMTFTEKQTSRDRLIAIDQAELVKRRKEEAKNLLEAYLYRLRDLADGEETSPFIVYSQDEERKKLSALLQETFHWLAETGESATLKDLQEKRTLLERIERPIQTRFKETETIVPAIADLEQAHIAANSFLESARTNYTMESALGVPTKYTQKELEDVDKLLNESVAWLKEKTQQQKVLARNEDPVLLTSEVKARGMALQSHVLKLLRRKVPKAAKTATTTTEKPTASSHEESKTSTSITTSTETAETTGTAKESTRERDEL